MQLGIGMIRMYEGMIDKEYNPLLDVLRSRTNAIKHRITEQVKHEMGYYDLVAEVMFHVERITELRDQIAELVGSYTPPHISSKHISKGEVDKEVERRLVALNAPLQQALDLREEAIKAVKLAGVNEDVKNVFAGVSNDINTLTSAVKSLPPIDKVLKQIPIKIKKKR